MIAIVTYVRTYVCAAIQIAARGRCLKCVTAYLLNHRKTVRIYVFRCKKGETRGDEIVD
jgi:hypothetical protein